MSKKKKYEYRESHKNNYDFIDGEKIRSPKIRLEDKWRYNPNENYMEEEDEQDDGEVANW
jgi:hypothetical protein